MRCDAHVHVVESPARYPQSTRRTYLAPLAPLTQLQALGAAREIRRFVIVQPSFYGTDNSLLLDCLQTLGANGRGVVAVDPTVLTRAEIAHMLACGVRGVRVNLYSAQHSAEAGARTSFSQLFPANAVLAQTANWHVEVIASAQTLADNAQTLADAPAPIVIDHYGLHHRVTTTSAVGQSLLELIRLPHVWVKLSAPYRSHSDALRIEPDRAWLDALLQAAASRCVWGSDWPWTPAFDQHLGADVESPWRALDYGVMFDAFAAAMGGELLESILQDNPARLYGFETP